MWARWRRLASFEVLAFNDGEPLSSVIDASDPQRPRRHGSGLNAPTQGRSVIGGHSCYLFSFYILLRIAFGVRSARPNSSATPAKSRALKVAMPSARPFGAASSTMSSSASLSLGRHRKWGSTGSATAASTSRTISVSATVIPAFARCSGRSELLRIPETRRPSQP